MTRFDEYRKLFSGDPLDRTYMAKVIASDPVGKRENQRVRMEDWRADLKRRVRNRLAEQHGESD